MDLTNYKASAVADLKKNVELAKRDATSLVKIGLDLVEEVTDGRATIVDATNPWVMLLEMGAVLASTSVNESLVLLREQYPVLAIEEKDLYTHMSDEDYLNRFATPVTTTITVGMGLLDLENNMVYDASEECWKAVIPRDTRVVVDGLWFMFLYPVVFRKFNNGVVQVNYDESVTSPLMALRNTLLPYTVRRSPENLDFLFVDLDAKQVMVNSVTFPVEKAYSFSKNIPLVDQFCYARVFQKSNLTQNLWKEIKTTHTDQVFDPLTPTAVLKVTSTEMNIFIPVIYLTNNLVSGQIRVDVYTTRGQISINLSSFRVDAFVVTMTAIDEDRDLNVYTEAFNNITFFADSKEIASGGSNGLSFEELRQRVIFNSVGPQNLPITSTQLQAEGENQDFDIVKNIDVLTNRAYLATRRLPTPSNERLITAANIGIVTYLCNLSELREHDFVIDNGPRLTIPSNTMYRADNAKVSFLTQSQLDELQAMGQTAMVNHVNQSQYLYCPFHYVLDSSQEEFDVRVYALDRPVAKGLNFVRQNASLQLLVNTGSYVLERTPSGYKLVIRTRSGNFYQTVPNAAVGVQLAFYPHKETTLAYINGVLETSLDTGERQFAFYIETNYDLNNDDLICITNAQVEGIGTYEVWIPLNSEFHLLHHTTSITANFQADQTDILIGKFLLPPGSVGNTHEKLNLTLGYALKNLWRRNRSYVSGITYRRYDVDIPEYYEEDIYRTDPDTGSIVLGFDGDNNAIYEILHHQGDPVLDDQGQPVLKYRKDIDIVRDENGNPIVEGTLTSDKEFDLFVVDGRYMFANDEITVAYRSEVVDILTDWIVNDLVNTQGQLLEQTGIFFYPKTTLGTVKILIENSGSDYIDAEQDFKVVLFVKFSVYNDQTIRNQLRVATIRLLDQAISQNTINMTKVFADLRELYGDSVPAFQISGLGGDRNYQLVTMAEGQNNLCLKKELIIQPDLTMIVDDAVDVEFRLVS